LDKIVTIRDIDWEKLVSYFLIPNNIKDIDFKKIKFNKQEKLLRYEKNMVLQMFNQNTTNTLSRYPE